MNDTTPFKEDIRQRFQKSKHDMILVFGQNIRQWLENRFLSFIDIRSLD